MPHQAYDLACCVVVVVVVVFFLVLHITKLGAYSPTLIGMVSASYALAM